MVLNEEKRAKLADVLALREEGATGAGASTLAPNIAPAAPSPAPSAPLNVVPLAAAGASPTPAPLDVVPLAAAGASSTPVPLKQVVEIVSDDDADTTNDLVFKKRRMAIAAISHSSSIGRPASLRDHPPAPHPPKASWLSALVNSLPKLTPSPTRQSQEHKSNWLWLKNWLW